MKKILFVLFLFSCSGESKLSSEIEKSIKAIANNPGSYEPVQTIIVDTVTYLDNLNKYLKDGEGLPSLEKERAIRDSLLKSPNPNAIASFLVEHTFRIKNEFNATILNDYYFEVMPDLTVSNFYSTNETGKHYECPGGWPGHIIK